MVNTNQDDRIFAGELFIVRSMVVIYVAFAHFAKVIFWFSGLKIAYINHKPWSYKKMWKDFVNDEYSNE